MIVESLITFAAPLIINQSAPVGSSNNTQRPWHYPGQSNSPNGYRIKSELKFSRSITEV